MHPHARGARLGPCGLQRVSQQRATKALTEEGLRQAEIENFHPTVRLAQQFVVTGDGTLVIDHQSAVMGLLDQLAPLRVAPAEFVGPLTSW